MSLTNPVDNSVSILGMGAMGRTLAKTLLQNGYPVTVWNRSQSAVLRSQALALRLPSILQAQSPAVS